MASTNKIKLQRRATRTRKVIAQTSGGRPRLSVFRSSKNISAQIIDDAAGRTLAAASSLDKDIKSAVAKGWNVAAASAVGKALAERAAKAGVKDVVFDRGGYMYHGRVKALAEAAREGGLKF
jgi:large subunit ribosomal protein L18